MLSVCVLKIKPALCINWARAYIMLGRVGASPFSKTSNVNQNTKQRFPVHPFTQIQQFHVRVGDYLSVHTHMWYLDYKILAAYIQSNGYIQSYYRVLELYVIAWALSQVGLRCEPAIFVNWGWIFCQTLFLLNNGYWLTASTCSHASYLCPPFYQHSWALSCH